jgi:predicted nucleic acid-binding protein
MQIVIDASAIIAVIANEPKKMAMLELTTGADLIAPASIRFEIGNAFSAMLKRHRITLTQALAAVALYQSIL